MFDYFWVLTKKKKKNSNKAVKKKNINITYFQLHTCYSNYICDRQWNNESKVDNREASHTSLISRNDQ